MAAKPDSRPLERAEGDRDRIMREFFEPQLRRIGLAEDQVQKQDIAELEVSLQRVNDAILNPDSFGKFKIEISTKASVIITRAAADAHIELGILPLLLERKGQILARIRLLRPAQQLNEIREDIEAGVEDPKARENLIEVIDRRLEEQRKVNEKLDQEQVLVESARVEAEERQQRLKIEIRERRSAIYRSFLERESVASVVGAVLLLALAATLIIAMFSHITVSDIIANAFLLILGYFFGQSTAQGRSQGTDKADNA